MTDHNTLIIAQSQQTPMPLQVAKATAQLNHTAQQAAAWGAQLLVLPEMCMTGYNLTAQEIQTVAESSNGPLYNNIAALAQKHQLAIAYGYAERGQNKTIYNAVQLIDQHGNALLNYRKTHLWGDLDRRLFVPGNALSSVVTISGWRVGAAICYDIEFPETTRHLALQGAELVIVPTGLMQPWRDVATKVVPVRAYENRFFMAYTNYSGTERELCYEGYSCIADPNGYVLASAVDKPVILTATLQRSVLTQARQDLPYLANRRPELYAQLSTLNAGGE